jgi:indolepyruvate ferredoxin oxidoreductase
MVTGRMPVPGHGAAVARVESVTRSVTCLDAHELAEALFGDHMPANLLLVGAAYQQGLLPVSAAAIEQAITLNRAAVEQNLAAFRWGRAAVADPEAVRQVVVPAAEESAEKLDEVVAVRVADLTGYQNAAYASTYAEDVRRVTDLATERAGEEAGTEIALAYARGLHKLMAYKDEYEVARLHLDPAEQAKREREFGAGAEVSVLLHPPVLRAMGMKRKIKLRRSAPVLFRGLRADVFGMARVRRVERELVGEYRDLVRAALARLTPATAGAVAEIAGLPELIRGYEDIKLARVAEFRERARTALARLEEPVSSVEGS